MRIATLIFSIIVLSSCGTGVTVSYQKGAKKILKAKCNGLARDIGSCHEQASNVCSGEYTVVDQESTNTGSYSTYQSAGLSRINSTSIQGINRNLYFHCNNTEPKLN